jgi:DNA-binding transcriptional ArsR family regulator
MVGALPATLDALADPTRLAIVTRLREGPQSVAVLARDLPVSRPAVSIHLRVLADARLVTRHRVGARNFYVLQPQGIAELRAWLDGLWGDALTAFAAHVERIEAGEHEQ